MNYYTAEGIGVNPMYQSSTTSLVKVQPSEKSEYSEIPTRRSVLHNTYNQHMTTANILYSSVGEALRHPTLMAGQTNGQFSPDIPFSDDEEKSTCKCSPDAFLFVCSMLVILLSAITIVLALLLMFGVITSGSTGTGGTTVVSTTTANNSSSVSSTRNQTEAICDCSNSITFDNNKNFTEISDSIYRISQAITQFRYSENMSVSDTLQQLSEYLSQIKAINDSLQQLRPQSNQPREPLLTGLNLTANITINPDECVNERTSCTITPDSLFLVSTCQSPIIQYANETHIVISVSGSVNNNTHELVNGTSTSLVIEERQAVNLTDTTFERLQKFNIFHLCYNYNNIIAVCNINVRRCSYQRNNVTSTVSVR